jgi:uncharacterized protein
MDIKLEGLITSIKRMKNVLIAFSGGADSSLLLQIAHEVLGDHVLAVTISSPMHPRWEINQAIRFAKKLNVQHIIIELDEAELNEVFENNTDRCYSCKKLIFSKLKKIADDRKIHFILDGSNVDDSSDYRPGFKALHQLGIISPLRDMGLTKQEIRALSKDYDLETYNSPTFACLASRIPYKTPITTRRLRQIEQCEEIIRKLDIDQFRVRYHDEIARIEVLKKDYHIIIENTELIVDKFKKQGFQYVTLDLEGYRTGSLNEGLVL